MKRAWEKLWCRHHLQERWPLQVLGLPDLSSLQELKEVMTSGGDKSQGWLPGPHWGVLHQSAYHHCVTQILLLCGYCYPMQQESSLSGSDMVVDGPRSSAHSWHYLPWVPSLQGCWRSQEGRASRAEKSYDQGKDVWSNELHQLFSSHTDLMLYRCLLPLRTDLELALLRPLNKLQQPLEQKKGRWMEKKFLLKKK